MAKRTNFIRANLPVCVAVERNVCLISQIGSRWSEKFCARRDAFVGISKKLGLTAREWAKANRTQLDYSFAHTRKLRRQRRKGKATCALLLKWLCPSICARDTLLVAYTLTPNCASKRPGILSVRKTPKVACKPVLLSSPRQKRYSTSGTAAAALSAPKAASLLLRRMYVVGE